MTTNKRWNIVVNGETDKAVRVFLALHDGKKGDLSKLVEEAVRVYLTKPEKSTTSVTLEKKRASKKFKPASGESGSPDGGRG